MSPRRPLRRWTPNEADAPSPTPDPANQQRCEQEVDSEKKANLRPVPPSQRHSRVSLDFLTRDLTALERMRALATLDELGAAHGVPANFILASVGSILDAEKRPKTSAELTAFDQKWNLDWGRLYSLFLECGHWLCDMSQEYAWFTSVELADRGLRGRDPLEAWQRRRGPRSRWLGTNNRGDGEASTSGRPPITVAA